MATTRNPGELTFDPYRVIRGGAIAVGIGVVVCLLVAGTAAGGPYWSSAAELVMFMLASVAIAGLLGLIFGVPRTRTDVGVQTTTQFGSNSNLEQISDWLTKILVGAGLVQLGMLPGGISSLATFLSGGMALPNAAAISVAAVLYGLGVGFLFFYLWARLQLRVQLEDAEKQAEERSRREVEVAAALAQAVAKSDTTESTAAIKRVASDATAKASQQPALSSQRVLWVDDNPVNNQDIVSALRTLGVTVDLALTTQGGMSQLATQSYGLVITDLGRREAGVENLMAGADLLKQIRESGRAIPVFVYGGRRAVENRQELMNLGATLVTNRPTELFENAVGVLTERSGR